MTHLVLFGPPGAGKGTQSAFLVAHYGFIHLSTGDIFRRNIKGKTELGNLAKSYMDKGRLVPDEVTIALLKDAWSSHADAKALFSMAFRAQRLKQRHWMPCWKAMGIRWMP
jgi:adenylate kinase